MNTSVLKFDSLTKLLIHKRGLWHLIYWLLYAATRMVSYYYTILFYDHKYLEFMVITDIGVIGISYLTLYIYYKRGPFHYFKIYFSAGLLLWVIFIAMVVSFQKYYLQQMPEIESTKWVDLFLSSLSSYILVFILLTLAKAVKDNYITQYFKNERNNLQIITELQNLKAQISPHFLFNTMNNFYGLAVEQSIKLPELMVRLSELLRYSLYETNNPTVPLSNEVAYLKNYIELEKIRLEDTLEFQFIEQIFEPNEFYIAPLLFVVFVENAFKHAKNVKNDVIRIKIKIVVDASGLLTFEVINNFASNYNQQNFSENGIGLHNVKKRLCVIYPHNKHHLIINSSETTFEIKLTIHLQ